MIKKPAIPKPLNRAEETLALQLKLAGIPFEREYKFALPRQFRADFALHNHLILIEIEGGIHKFGRHNRAAGYIADMEKYNLAALKGYTVVRFTPDQVIRGKAIRQIADFIVKRESK